MKIASPIAFLALVALFATGCPTFEGVPYSYGPNGIDCPSNNPPAVGNVELNSFFDPTLETFFFSIHFDWVDPGVQGAGDPPNMRGGRFTAEIFGYTTPDIELTEDVLVRACSWPEVEDGASDPCVLSGHGSSGCPPGGNDDSCTQGEITVPIFSPDGAFTDGQILDLEFRVRDLCDATSNEKSATYQIGSGLAVEGGGGGDDDDTGE